MTRRSYKIALLEGDGTGPEVVAEGRRVLDVIADRANVTFDTNNVACGAQLYEKTKREWAEGGFEYCRDEADAILLGAIGWPGVSLPNGDIAGAGVVFGLRFGLDLYANVRPCKMYPGVRHKIGDAFKNVWEPENVDMVIIRENTEGLYTPARGALTRGGTTEVAVDNNIITHKGSERVIRYAFELAKRRHGAPKDGAHRLSCIDKSNVLRGSQLFREVYDEVASGYPGIERDYAYVDAFTQWLVRTPEFYDVAVTTNMFGDIVTDLAAVLQGGMGMAASGNIGDHHGMFEPVHGSAPKHAGKGVVNPLATVQAIGMMVDWLGTKHDDSVLVEAAKDVDKAVAAVVAEGVVTYDLGGKASTRECGDAVVRALTNL